MRHRVDEYCLRSILILWPSWTRNVLTIIWTTVTTSSHTRAWAAPCRNQVSKFLWDIPEIFWKYPWICHRWRWEIKDREWITIREIRNQLISTMVLIRTILTLDEKESNQKKNNHRIFHGELIKSKWYLPPEWSCFYFHFEESLQLTKPITSSNWI